jgi:AcrR family transcriptional regulator
MARPRSAGYEDQREAILAASARLFATRGYTATTMNEVAAACGISKATLYHYVRDKQGLLAQITGGHVARLEALVSEVGALGLPARAAMSELIHRFMQAYASAEHQHRVLTEDVGFLGDADRQRVLDGQRRVVAAFADAVAALRPDLAAARLHKPLAMLLFGMINWTFTWLHAGGVLSHETLAPVVVELFFGGLPAVSVPAPR